jgi:hypothetical protein
MELTYSRVSDYLLPDLILNDPPPKLAEPITKYGSMRRAFLREHRTITYDRLVLTEQLFPHLRAVQREAHRLLDRFMSDILVFQPPPDKSTDNFAWATHMIEVKRIAEKMMLDAVVYDYD